MPLIRIHDLGSTNDLARLLAATDLPEGTAVVARRQSQGRGRHGRLWASPDGGLWCSVVLRPARETGWGQLSLAVAIAVAEAIERTTGLHALIRWPNDVIVDGRKAAGILLERAGGAVVVGIGINVNVPREALPESVRATAASLHETCGRQIDLEVLLERLFERGTRWYDAWVRGDPEVLTAWAARDSSRDRRIVVHSEGARIEGVAEGVDHDGALRIRLTSGEVRRVLAGDLESEHAPVQERFG